MCGFIIGILLCNDFDYLIKISLSFFRGEGGGGLSFSVETGFENEK